MIRKKYLSFKRYLTLKIKMTDELFYRLLDQGEGNLIDFKTSNYFSEGLSKRESKDKTYDFVKDIISFANTPRSKSAYILIGVKEKIDKKGFPVGVPDSQLIDDASYQEKIKNKVQPIPIFFSEIFITQDNKKIIVIEIPVVKYSRPIELRDGYGDKLKKDKIYFRRGSSNSEATPEDIYRIFNWLGRIEEFTHLIKKEVGIKKSKVAPIIKSVFVIGGVTGESEKEKYEESSLNAFCLRLGEELADAGIKLIICSPFPDSADYYTAKGYALSDHGEAIHFHTPGSVKIKEELAELEAELFPDGPSFVTWFHPEPEKIEGKSVNEENREARKQAYLISQFQALKNAEAVIAIGGKRWASANTLLHLAEWEGIPVVPFNFLGGAAGKFYDKINWQSLHPKIDTKLLNEIKGANEIIKIMNQLKIDFLFNSHKSPNTLKKIFISRSRIDKTIGDDLAIFLKSKDLELFFGDEMYRTDQELIISIKKAMLAADIIIVLWSQHYALSKWCYDELMLAIDRQKTGHSGLWIFNLDNSDVIPFEARSKDIFNGESILQIKSTIDNFLLELN